MNVMAAIETPLVSVRDLSIRFGERPNATVESVSFAIERGHILALVGESGSGKSLIAHALAGIITDAAKVTSSELRFDETDLAQAPSGIARLRGKRIGMVFQNARAALNPTLSIGRQIADVIRRHRRIRGKELRDAVIASLSSVLIPDAARRVSSYPHQLSGGMCQRVMLAMAMAGEPELLIADEPTTGLDATTQSAILELIVEQARSRRMATLFITHDLGLARAHADRIIVLHAGQVAELGPAERLFREPLHPYSAKLIKAVPAYSRSIDELSGIPGRFPDLAGPVAACRFAERCDRAVDQCRLETPVLQGDDHRVACWRPLP